MKFLRSKDSTDEDNKNQKKDPMRKNKKQGDKTMM